MLLSEFRSKELVAQYGVPVPPGRMARSPAEASEAARALPAEKYVVKAQIAAGGRGPAGGIRFAATPSQVAEETGRMLGSTLVTEQTGPRGETVEVVYVEAAETVKDSRYLALAIDPDSGGVLVLASPFGGTDFETRARTDPSAVRTMVLDDPADTGALGPFLASAGIGAEAAAIVQSAHRAFTANDMLLLEINPFARVESGAWMALDAKVALDASAAFRHPELETLGADPALPSAEREAQRSNINLVRLDGDIGVVVNGAGLGLATNDMIADAGGRPANFMDIRTTASSFDIARGVELLIADPGVRIILLNVHGGGMTVCDTVAEGVAFAYSRATRKPPVVARLAGQNADWGLRILRDRKVPVEVTDTMSEAVDRAVALAKGGR